MFLKFIILIHVFKSPIDALSMALISYHVKYKQLVNYKNLGCILFLGHLDEIIVQTCVVHGQSFQQSNDSNVYQNYTVGIPFSIFIEHSTL